MTPEHYIFENGYTMKREGENSHWHLRNGVGELVCRDKYCNDVIDRYRLKIARHHDPLR